jgi:hypothetical protein
MIGRMLRGTDTSGLVYHYTPAATAVEFILPDMILRLSQLRDTNDPGEEAPPSVCLGSPPEGLSSDIDRMMERRMLACFSRDRPGTDYHGNAPLVGHGDARDRMWAQYADSHRGVCLFFDRSTLESSFREQMASRGIALANDVSYRDKDFEVVVIPRPEVERIGRTEYLKQCAERDAFVKRSDWGSEQEYRLLFIPDVSQAPRPCESISIQRALAAICVGHRFPKGLLPCIREVCDREKINAFQLNYLGYPRIQPLYPTERQYPSPLMNLSLSR